MRSKTKRNIEKIVEECIDKNNLLKHGDNLLVAVSGGPDSVALLNILYKLKEKYNIKLSVAHVNHMIREESKEEKEYVKQICKNMNIDMFYLEKDVIKLADELTIGVESAGRKVRYEFFEKVANTINADKIAIAHNLDDNVETIFMNLIRGTGLKGLTGIEYESGKLIRPLLDVKKEEVMEYSEKHDLDPRIDYTNFQDVYIRNKIRLNLLKTLKEEYNPNILDSVIRMKNILKDEEDFLKEYVDNLLEENIIKRSDEEILFRFEKINNEHSSIKRRAIRSMITMMLGDSEGIELVHIEDILKLLNNNLPKKKYIIGNKFTIIIESKYIAKMCINMPI